MNGTTTVTADLTVTVPTALNSDADGAGDGADGGAVHVASAGTVSLAGGLEVLAGQTLTFPSNGANRWVIELVADQPRDGGDGDGQPLVLQGAATVTNAADGLWTVVDAGHDHVQRGRDAMRSRNAGTLRKTGAGSLSLQGSRAVCEHGDDRPAGRRRCRWPTAGR